ncbi:MAG: glycerol-3-phosphate acyltransferase [Chloroflexi bacterium]|nr:glycerol-3-phosphate acyltransferase [Chloroflexota bacterium]
MWTSILLIAAAYLWGSIPTAYLLARYKYGIDIRKYGSGNVGASNLMPHTGRTVAMLLGTFDSIGKGTLPILLLKLLGQEPWVQAAAGLAVVFAHNWSPYIRFTGGRGVATTIGVVLGYLMWPEFLILTVVMGLLGRVLFNELGFWTFIAMVSLPVLALIFGRPPEIIYACIGMSLLLLAKRLTANWESPRNNYPLSIVFFCRVLWDRDVPRRNDWVKRRPQVAEPPI